MGSTPFIRTNVIRLNGRNPYSRSSTRKSLWCDSPYRNSRWMNNFMAVWRNWLARASLKTKRSKKPCGFDSHHCHHLCWSGRRFTYSYIGPVAGNPNILMSSGKSSFLALGRGSSHGKGNEDNLTSQHFRLVASAPTIPKDRHSKQKLSGSRNGGAT